MEGVASVLDPVVVEAVEQQPRLTEMKKMQIKNILWNILGSSERSSEVKKRVIRRLGNLYDFPAPTVIIRKARKYVMIKIGDEEISAEL